MIAFSLNRDIDPQDIIRGVTKLIQREVSSQEEAESSVLVISISKVQQAVDKKLIESKQNA